jgi:hypothetical protein
MVNLPLSRIRLTSAARMLSAVFLGSMVSAKRALSTVYSWPQ